MKADLLAAIASTPTATFTFKHMHFTVKRSKDGQRIIYRETAHLGGPWSDAPAAIANTSLDRTFRTSLGMAAMQITGMSPTESDNDTALLADHRRRYDRPA